MQSGTEGDTVIYIHREREGNKAESHQPKEKGGSRVDATPAPHSIRFPTNHESLLLPLCTTTASIKSFFFLFLAAVI